MTAELRTGTRYKLSTSGIEQLPVIKIKRDGGTQSRAETSPEHVARLVDALKEGSELPPIVVFFDGEKYWLADGFHRVEAHTRLRGYEAVVPAEIRQGDRRAAVLYSVGANQSHGLPRSREDTRRAIETLLRDTEWGQWSDREIARQVGCNHVTVGTVRQKLASGGEINHLTERRAPDGKFYPATQPVRALNTERQADLITRANKLGYVVTPVNGGSKGYRISEGLTPMGGAKDLDELEAVLAPIEQRVAENERIAKILERTPLPPGWSWDQVNGDIRVVRGVNRLYSSIYTESQIADAVAWAEMHSADPITWDHRPDESTQSRIYSLKNYPHDPGAAAALAALIGKSNAALVEDEDEDEDEDCDDQVTVAVSQPNTCQDCGKAITFIDAGVGLGRCMGCQLIRQADQHIGIKTKGSVDVATWSLTQAEKYHAGNPRQLARIAELRATLLAPAPAPAPAPVPVPAPAPVTPKRDPAKRTQHIEHIKAQFAALLERLEAPELRVLYLVMMAEPSPPEHLDDEWMCEEMWRSGISWLDAVPNETLEWAVTGQ